MLVLIHFDLFFVQTVFLLAQEILDEQKENFNSLHFVTALWRHGARTPSILMGNDKENNETNLLGLGELTTKGFAQCYKLGKWIRKRYNKFLSPYYNPFEFFVRSSDFNRTLMSGQAVMAAIYPQAEKSELLGDWFPIPIHTTAKSNDKLIFDTTECLKVVNEEKRIFMNAEAKQIESENMVFLQFLSEKSSYNSSFLPLRELRYVFDSLYCNLENGDTIPDWVNESIKRHIWSLYDLSSFLLFSTDLMVRLKAGRLFTEIIHRMDPIINDKADKRLKFYAYSAHDTTVAGILAAFGVRPPIFPRFSSLVLIELHKLNNQNWIRLLYKNDSKNDELWEWPIEGCPSSCSLQKLKSARKKFLMLGENDECFESFGTPTREKVYLSLIVLLSLISASLAIYIIWGNHHRQIMHSRNFRFKMGEKSQSHVQLLNSCEEEEEEIELNSLL